MIRRFFSRYQFSYPRVLVYMLQSSEYRTGEYLDWYLRVKDFSRVEERKKFDLTLRSGLTLFILWFIHLFFFALVPLTVLKPIVSIVIAIIFPTLTALALVILSTLIDLFIKKPLEFLISYWTKLTLKKNKAIKIAIAGSYGKTTMREILKTVLSQGKRVAAPGENYNTPIGIARFIKQLKGDEEILIFELGEYYPGDIEDLCKIINPDIGIITGINEAHLKRTGSLKTTRAMIYELADFIGDKPLYLNGESDNLLPGGIRYSRSGIEDLKVVNPQTDLTGTSFSVGKIEFKSKLLGLHQIGPLSLSIYLARDFGLSSEEIERGVSLTQPFKHRLDPTTDNQGVTILDDSYNGNPTGALATIEFLSSLSGRRFYVTPGLVEMGEKTQEVHEMIGRQLALSGIEKIILIRNSVTPYIEKGFNQESGQGEIIWFDNALLAFTSLPLLTVQGDIVLLQNDWADQYI